MGQRLNIEITANDKVICNVYMHWSGYSDSAFLHAVDVVNEFKDYNYSLNNKKDYQEIFDRLRNALEGANMNEDEVSNMYEELHITLKRSLEVNRNDGLISFSKAGIEETRAWEEARVTIDILNKKVLYDTYWTDDLSEFIEEYEPEENSLIKIDENPFESWIPFDNFSEIAAYYLNIMNDDKYLVYDDTVIHFIQ